MRRDMQDGDGVTVTVGGVTHEFPADRVQMSVDETTDRGNTVKYRYAVLLIDLSDGEFPEDVTRHVERLRQG